MPLREYECAACGHRFERIEKFSDPHVKVCPQCGGEVDKLMSAPAVQFKGSGWYVTDYAGKGKESKSTKEIKDAKESAESTTKESKDTKDTKETKDGKAATDSTPKDTKPTKSTTKEN
jgi:putative FmdB family regulatory protein